MSAQPHPAFQPAPQRAPRRLRPWLIAAALAAGLAGLGWWSWRSLHAARAPSLPLFKIHAGMVRVILYAHGSLGGAQPDRLAAPSLAGGMLRLSYLLPDGSLVKPGEVVARFSAAQQQFQLLKAENGLAQARASIAAARAAMRAQLEEDGYALRHARAQVQLAQLAVRQNPLLAALKARENLLQLRAARAKLEQLQRDLAGRRQSGQAMIRIQKAAEREAQLKIALARHNIAGMTLRATRAGYLSIRPNPNQNFFFTGMRLPRFHLGDQIYPGTVVAEIPDFSKLRVKATLGEENRAYLAPGEQAIVSVMGLPGRTFKARVTDVGGETGPPWDRKFHCSLALVTTAPSLRPGMSVRGRITVRQMPHALWAPAEAVFGTGGKSYVYLRHSGHFVRRPVKVLLRSETRVALGGVREGERIALVNPQSAWQRKTGGGR